MIPLGGISTMTILLLTIRSCSDNALSPRLPTPIHTSGGLFSLLVSQHDTKASIGENTYSCMVPRDTMGTIVPASLCTAYRPLVSRNQKGDAVNSNVGLPMATDLPSLVIVSDDLTPKATWKIPARSTQMTTRRGIASDGARRSCPGHSAMHGSLPEIASQRRPSCRA